MVLIENQVHTSRISAKKLNDVRISGPLKSVEEISLAFILIFMLYHYFGNKSEENTDKKIFLAGKIIKHISGGV